MGEFWEAAFVDKQLMWGLGPSRSALWASELFAREGLQHVLIPGVGYGRNAQPFLERGMSVVGIEISETAIGLARSRLGLAFPIHHGSVTEMPFDPGQVDGVFCYGLAYLLAPAQRAKLFADCHAQLRTGGLMVFTLISKAAPMYGRGERLGEDWYEIMTNLPMYFYDEQSVQRELGRYGIVQVTPVDEPAGDGSFPFLNVLCRKT